MARLTGKTALITGGTTGIGLATAKMFIKEGARVAITGQNAERVAAAAQELGEGVIALRADVASLADMCAVAQRLKTDFGTLDILFANAGIAAPMPFSDVDEANIDRLLDVNVKGVIYSVQSMLPLLSNPSSVVFNASTLAEKGVPGMAVYAATKAAVRSLARGLTTEYTARGIRFNVVSPGLTETPIYSKLEMEPAAMEQWAAQMVAGVPAKRFAHADEIAKAVLFLASDDSSYMLGENLFVDGGLATI